MTRARPVVALVTDAIAPFHRGGKEQRYLELAGRLAERAEVHVYTMNWWRGPSTRHDGAVTYHAICPLVNLYSGSRRSIRQALLFAICCLRLLCARFDVIEADHMPYLPLLSLKLVAIVRRRRLIVTWHECWGPEYWRTYLGPLGTAGWLLERLAMRLPNEIIAASPQTADRLRQCTQGRARITVAPNGVDLDVIRLADPAELAADVIIVGRLLPHKRVDLALQALALLAGEGLFATATVIGSGPELSNLRALRRALALDDQVVFRQDVETQHELYGHLKAAKVAVFPSEREGFGIAVLEALACRVQVITTSAPDNLARHLVCEDRGDGIVCHPNGASLAAAIRTALAREQECTPGSQDWLRAYDWQAVSDDVAAVLA